MADMELLGYATRGAKVRHDAPGKDNIFIYENGEKVQYEVPDMSIAVAFMGDPEGALPSIIKAFQKSAQLLRVGVTFVPGFAAKQVTEDMTRAMVFSGVKNPMMLLPRIMYNFPKMSKAGYFGPKLKLVKEMEKLGISGTYSGDITDHIKEVQIEAGVLKRGKLDTFIHYAEVLSKASDIAVRGAVYEQTLAETKSATHPEGDKLLAAHRAREVINFSRRGASKSVDYVSRMAPFVNAQIQGMDKLFQAMGGSEAGTGLSPAKAKTVFWRRAGVMAAASFGYAMMMSGDDEYEKQEDYVKFGSWLLPKMGDLGGVPLGIPVPKELGMFFKVIPEAVVAYYKNHGTLQERDALELMGAVVRNFGTSMLTVPTPTLAKAVTEWATNYSLFMQRPLESASQQLLEPYARYGNQTSETTKDISKLLYHVGVGISPIHIENLMRNLLGTTAGIMLGVMDKFSNPNAPSRPLDKDLWMQFLGGSAFIQDEVGTRYMQDLYKMNKESTIAHNTLESKIIDDPEGYDKYAEDNKSKLAMYSVTKSLIDDLNKLNDVAKFVRNDKDATPDEKAETLLELRNGAANIAKEVRYLRQTKREIENE
jgi:hypothetical protein